MKALVIQEVLLIATCSPWFLNAVRGIDVNCNVL
jgi:hypothetical protein